MAEKGSDFWGSRLLQITTTHLLMSAGTRHDVRNRRSTPAERRKGSQFGGWSEYNGIWTRLVNPPYRRLRGGLWICGLWN
jgi:hypothetical protein